MKQWPNNIFQNFADKSENDSNIQVKIAIIPQVDETNNIMVTIT